MSSPQFEAFLARLYTDAQLREAFLHDSHASASKANLSTSEVEALCNIDRAGLQMAAHSFAKKRESYGGDRRSWWTLLLSFIRR